jgi:aquaporin Z
VGRDTSASGAHLFLVSTSNQKQTELNQEARDKSREAPAWRLASARRSYTRHGCGRAIVTSRASCAASLNPAGVPGSVYRKDVLMNLSKKLTAEALGTFWLVLGGTGSAVLAAAFPALGIGFAGVSLAFGLTVLTGAYAFGHISGGHFNPAVTIGLATARRFPLIDAVPYIVAQLLGAVAASALLSCIAGGQPGFDLAAGGLGANGYGAHSPGHFSLLAAFLAEATLSFVFLLVILGATRPQAPAGFAPIAIGLCLTLIHLISIPVTNTSVNPARSTAPALFVGGWAIEQLWLFWAAPMAGALAAGLLHPLLCEKEQ